MNGTIDEVAVWSRALDDLEVKELYLRGASRIKYQVRLCPSGVCTSEIWQGPDGTSQTYFSELNNNSVPLDGTGDVLTTLPSMALSGIFDPLVSGRYFQYRAILETDRRTFSPAELD